MKKESIVFINQSSGYLMVDIINSFAGHCIKRTLIAGSINARNNPLDSDVKFEKIVAYNRGSPFRRAFTWFAAFLQIIWLVKTKYRNSHLFIVSNPPLATFVPIFCSNAYSFLIYDIYPETLIENGVLSNKNRAVKWWYKQHERVFERAKTVYTLNKRMKKILSRYNTKSDIKVVPIWTDNDFLKPVPKAENSYRRNLGIKDEFLISYSGNLGKSHNIEWLIGLAREMVDENVLVLITGGGFQYKALESKISDCGLGNIIIKPWQPTEYLPQVLSAADISVVVLGKGSTQYSMPSKTYNILSVGCPILAISEPESELADFVSKNGIGNHFRASEIGKIKDYVLTLKKDKKRYNEMQNKALHLSEFYSARNVNNFVTYELNDENEKIS